MILIVGLGNPGEKYKRTRHNLGFRVLDELQKIHSFSDWQKKKKLKAEISEGIINGKKTILAKPQTFMNDSGYAVKKLTTNYKPSAYAKASVDKQTTNLWVVHDDLDIELGKIKVVQNRGSAGHKGVQSIIDSLCTKNFIRFRLGIKPQEKEIKNVERFVLQKSDKDEEKIIKETIKETCQLIQSYEFNYR